MLAIIPARGGSKGLPGKNLMKIGGKSLVARAVEAGLQAKNISRVIISTDDPKIANEAVLHGAECPFLRPPELATDTALAIDVYLYTLERLKREEKKAIDAFTVLQPTSPLRIAEDVDGAVQIFRERDATAVISVTEAETPISWYVRINDSGVMQPVMPEASIKNRQELPVLYVPNGAVYVFDVAHLAKTRQYMTEGTYPFIMPADRSIDVDTRMDFEIAKLILAKQQKETEKKQVRKLGKNWPA